MPCSEEPFSLLCIQQGKWILCGSYADAIVITGDYAKGITDLKSHLQQRFQMKDLRQLCYILGLRWLGSRNEFLFLRRSMN